jgi:hypothetical protein
VILGAIQVVVGVADVAAAEPPLLAQGYARSFREQLVSHPAKTPLLGVPRAAGLTLLHLTAPPGDAAPAVELTSYEGAPPAGAPAFTLDGARIVAPTHDAAASGAFWDALRATGEPRRFAAALPAWRLGVVTPSGPDHRGRTTVDADGCVLVSVLATDVAAELQRLHATGLLGRATDIWEERVDGRTLRVAIVEGPAGELVELLQIASR